MMLLCYHGMVPLQHLCDIGAVTDFFLCFVYLVQSKTFRNIPDLPSMPILFQQDYTFGMIA